MCCCRRCGWPPRSLRYLRRQISIGLRALAFAILMPFALLVDLAAEAVEAAFGLDLSTCMISARWWAPPLILCIAGALWYAGVVQDRMAPAPQFLVNYEVIEIHVSYSWHGLAHMAVQAAVTLALVALLALHKCISLATAAIVFSPMATGLLVCIAISANWWLQ